MDSGSGHSVEAPGVFTELTACSTCGTLWRRELGGPQGEVLEIVAKRLRREPALTDPPNGHRVVFWKCHTCGADHVDGEWSELLASVGVGEKTGQTPHGPPRQGLTNPFTGSTPPPQLMRPPAPQR
ncbi:hypothetical protein HYH03_009628 [Edaphochlamys debaryana]|uniref:Uncharacterized protein n=1 Tax=Edaphochlamys debaryana TaxID=47281 RepID=A0A835XVZ0_9CHLO|nr:hypothetical protein HYH03_009628 [Edaphochlamys debaryana]|eukprot:KAG2492137.1 hypothetical protein HYH03_009628 [Edaphochlamys debaryana]